MANPQAENGHIDIANELADEFQRLQLSGNQWRILWVILRQTWGWHKKADRISLSQFAERTGITTAHIARELKNMVDREIISKSNETYVASYGLQKNYDLWKTTAKIGTTKNGSTRIGRGALPELAGELLPKLADTKEKKETSKKKVLRDSKKTNPADPSEQERKKLIKSFIEQWCGLFKESVGGSYHVNWGKDSKLIKELLLTHKFGPLFELAQHFFKSEDPYIKKCGHTIGVFSTQINKLVEDEKQKKGSW